MCGMNILITLLIVLIGTLTGEAVPFNHTQEGGPPSLEAQMVALYSAAADDVNRLAGHAIEQLNANADHRAAGFREIRAARLTIEIQRRLDLLGSQSKVLINGPLKDSINKAIARGDEELAKIGLKPDAQIGGVPGNGVSFSLVSGEAVEVIAQDTLARKAGQIADALGDGMATHAANANTIFKTLSASLATSRDPQAEVKVNNAIARGLITGNPILADRAIRELFAEDSDDVKRVRKLGNKQIIVGKATMSVRQYAMTVTRTRMREATVEARHRRLTSRGVNLVQITGRNSSNFCTAFLGLVCSIGPAPEIAGLDIIELSTLPGGGPPFHPNCSKGTSPYIHELASPARQASAHRALTVYTTRAAKGDLLKQFT
jgi:hypothetical protein